MKSKADIEQAALELKRRHAARDGGGMLYRVVEFEIDQAELAKRAAAGDATGVLLPISLSSETPVERYDWWDDETYTEILDHGADSVDLSRAKMGMPFLVDHNARDWKSHLGVLENTRVDTKDRKLRADVRFSARQDAQDLRRDMLDGIRPKISVGYQVDADSTKVTGGRPSDKPKVVRYMKWTPMEGSSVAIPADENVGVGRSLDGSWDLADIRALRAHIEELQKSPTPAPKAEERAVPDTTAAAASNGAASAGTTAAAPDVTVMRAEVRDEVKRIIELAKSHNMENRVSDWLGEGKDLEAVRSAIMETYQKNLAKSIADPTLVDLTEREKKQYNLGRGIQIATNQAEKHGETKSLETEVSDELEKKRPEGLKRMGGLLVPMCMDAGKARMHNAMNEHGLYLRRQLQSMAPSVPQARAGLYTGSAAAGGDLVFTVPGEFLELLRNFMAVYSAGASYMTGLQGPIAFPQQIGAATASWVAENPGSDVADSNLTLQLVNLTPKTIQASTSYSRQLWVQSVVDVDAAVKQDLAAINALALDLAAIAGTGSSNQPTGITNWSGTASYAMGTNGATPGYADLVGLETLITAANADQWPLSYLVHPTTRGTFKKATVLSNTVGMPVWTNSEAGAAGQPALQAGGTSRKRGEMNGYDAWSSAQVPNNLTKGSSSGICLAGIFGAFPTLVIGDWGMFEIIVDPFRLKKQGMIELTSFAMYGIALKFAAAFAVCKDFLA